MERTNILKVVVIGDSTTGKTSIVHRYVKNIFLEQVRPTIGVEFFNKDVTVQNNSDIEEPSIHFFLF